MLHLHEGTCGWMRTASMTGEVSKIMYRVMDLSMGDGSFQPVPQYC
jgi:hypothetical protein